VRLLIATIAVALGIAAAPAQAGVTPVDELPAEELRTRITADAASAAVYRRGLEKIVRYVRKDREGIFRPVGDGAIMPTAEAKAVLRRTWAALLDYTLALESIRRYHRRFYKVDDDMLREGSFLIHYGAFLAQYRSALEFLDLLDSHPHADTILNEAAHDMGLGTETLAEYKYRFLNVKAATSFAALAAVDRTFPGEGYLGMRAAVDSDAVVIWEMGKGRGERLTLKNAMVIIGEGAQRAWLPVQEGVSRWMGDVRVRRDEQFFISSEQLDKIRPLLMPGDILLQRREWYLSNVGLPGFWTHAALYVGTREERVEAFETGELSMWMLGQNAASFEELLRKVYPRAYALSSDPVEEGNSPRVVEAVGEGVIFTSLEHSGAADSMAVLRPRLPVDEKARAVYGAFGYSGRPYDFEFDFVSDTALVCSELVYKVYEPAEGFNGVRFPLENLMGKTVVPPNGMAELFDREFDSPDRQLDLVLFLDGYEAEGTAVEAGPDEFRRSWRRPKWHVLTQPPLPRD